MKKEDCWMSFSEALETYLTARDCLANKSAGWKDALMEMNAAAIQLDALVGGLYDE